MTDCLIDIAEDDGQILFYVQPKDANPASEFQRQKTALAMLAKFAPKVIVIATPNGRKGTDWEMIRAHNEGMVAGAPDLGFWWSMAHLGYAGCAVAEFKNGKAMPRANQVMILNRFHRAGVPCGVFRDGTALLRWLKNLGAPVIIQ